LLATDLRIAFSEYFGRLLHAAAESGHSLSEVPSLEGEIRQKLAELEPLLLRTAWRHGFVTWVSVKAFVDAPVNVDLLLAHFPTFEAEPPETVA